MIRSILLTALRASGTLLVWMLVLGVRPATAAAFDVPVTHATLQAAVAAAAISADLDNVITISASPVSTNNTVSIGAAFSGARRLTIRPAANLPRASVVNANPTVPIVDMTSAGFVTLQDLDILRNITNGDHLVVMNTCEEILIERCRIGSNWVTTGTPGWSNVFITYPTGIVMRNNLLFANTPGTFDNGISAGNFNDPANSLRLYNNVVADHKIYGIRIEAGIAGALVLLRNNVVANQASLAPEPFAYRTEVAAPPTVVASHNVAFAGAAFVLSGAGQDIAGLASSFLNFVKADVIPSFDTVDWAMTFDANPDFYRLLAGGPLHDDAGDYGMTVTTNGPDRAVLDDIEKDVRPGGVSPHSDRGADQLEPGTANTGVGAVPIRGTLLASVHANPSRFVSIAYATHAGGHLELSVVDLAGRVVHRAVRIVSAESRGRFDAPTAGRPGIHFYRLRLTQESGLVEEANGRVALIR
ncbi:MAG: hypothetical protein HOP12_14060 [Candidatus Eisenbacteria bacterium]|uniref:Right handed beta helix domain-containing protein n=1 Tax=Eiseniibacteriota bacterium TaxID=2212470 RepID=A0A849SRK2_UNCEI|nr:hypothetical protein [Candidatus Eisenbacteria bacterium]